MEIEKLEPEGYYHIYNRAINKQPFLLSIDHYQKFLFLYEKYIPQVADTFAYCLLPNHFHFLVRPYPHPDGVLKSPRSECAGDAFGNLFNSYAQWFNKKTSRTGGLFQRPFKRKRILDDEYLKYVVYYIHRNPLHHSISRQPDEYPYSSYKSIIWNEPGFINQTEILNWFDNKDNLVAFHSEQFEIEAEGMFD